ncbi:hypothetical protein TSUD_218630 [Trifolium subterraneum]|uniref:Reverse transcriptase zinc-binding domain-containing protein n=1 Tax=Trifolium subterraneum TaxID=3900 RepID=A0A2Z6M0B6_TRISU|nr:hypothetical protein TSUD_218630 [Trifolium subterraneum]
MFFPSSKLPQEYGGLGVRQLKEFNLALLGGRGSSWWREIAKIRDGVGGLGSGWFRESVVKRVGNGAETFFWTDPWGRCVGLAETFVGVGGGDVEGVSDLTFELFFSVTLGEAETLIWHKQVPLKVSICAWQLLRDRLPTRKNLVSRGIISPEAHFCVSGCGGIESTQNLFFTCGTFGSLWSVVRFWIGFSSVDHQNPPGHFLQFVSALGERRARRSFMQLIWLACVWVLWNERNNRLFINIAQTVPQMLDKVKLFSLWWLKTANVTLVVN